MKIYMVSLLHRPTIISIRWVDTDFAINEDFLGLYAMSKADAESLTGLRQDVLLRFTLDIP